MSKFIAPASITILLILAACSGNPARAPTIPPAPVSGAPTQPSSQPPPGGGSLGATTTGTIVTISAKTMILNTSQRQVTVNLNSNTTVEQTLAAAVEDLKVGQFLSVVGTPDEAGNVAASSISARPANQLSSLAPPGGIPDGRFGGTGNGTFGRGNGGGTGNNTFSRGNRTFNPDNRTAGTLSAMDGSTLTINTFEGKSVTVTVTPSTTIQLTVSGSVSELRPGESVTVLGRPDSSGKINAFSIVLR